MYMLHIIIHVSAGASDSKQTNRFNAGISSLQSCFPGIVHKTLRHLSYKDLKAHLRASHRSTPLPHAPDSSSSVALRWGGAEVMLSTASGSPQLCPHSPIMGIKIPPSSWCKGSRTLLKRGPSSSSPPCSTRCSTEGKDSAHGSALHCCPGEGRDSKLTATCGDSLPFLPVTARTSRGPHREPKEGFGCCQRAVLLVPNGSYPSQLAPRPGQARLASAGMLPRILTRQLEESMLQCSQLCKKRTSTWKSVSPPPQQPLLLQTKPRQMQIFVCTSCINVRSALAIVPFVILWSQDEW